MSQNLLKINLPMIRTKYGLNAQVLATVANKVKHST